MYTMYSNVIHTVWNDSATQQYSFFSEPFRSVMRDPDTGRGGMYYKDTLVTN